MNAMGRCALLLLIVASVTSAEPLPIAPHEKAACEIVASFLSDGAPAFYGALASDAPLRGLGRRDALGEISARVGPPEGSLWTLRTVKRQGKHCAAFAVVWPSQIDDVVTLEMVQEEGTWKIRSIRTLGEIRGAPPKPRPRKKVVAVDAPVANAKERVGYWFVGASIAAPLFSAVAAVIRRRRPRGGQVLLLLAVGAFLAQVTLLFYKPSQPSEAPSARAPAKKLVEIRALAPLRAALNAGEEPPPLPGGPPDVVETAKLWIAQAQLLTEQPAGVARQIDALEVVGRTPLAELLRARMAADRGSVDEALQLYDRAVPGDVPHDAFWLEGTLAASDPERARGLLAKWEANGCRDANLYYLLSGAAVTANQPDAARAQFLRAWRIQPMPREDVVSAGIFSEVLRDPAVAGIVNLKSPEEWKGAALELGNDPMGIPPGVTALASGTFLLISSGDAELAIPAGARIAPAKTTVVAASEWRRREREAALARFEETGVLHRRVGAAMFPRLELAIEALSERNRWDRVTELTEWVGPDSEGTTGAILLARLEALLRAERREEARALALGTVVGRSARYGGGGLLVALGDRLLASGEFDTALESYKRAAMARNAPDVSARIRQVEMRRRLALSPRIRNTQNFEIRSTPDVPPEATAYIGGVLERELPSIAEALGLPYFNRTTVSVVNWVDFATDLTGGMDVLGFYDSEIVIPFANMPGYAGAIQRVLSHELTHAVLAQATGDLAPRWYHEGVASRFEDAPEGDNVFANRSAGEILSLSVLDATLNNSFDADSVGEAYATSHTLIRYLERTYGEDVLLRLNEAYRSGQTAATALESVTGRSTVEIDAAFREWGRSNSRAFANRGRERAVDPSVRSGIRFSRERTP